MGYKVDNTLLGSLDELAKGTIFSSGITFKLADYKDSNGISYYQGDTYTGRYINCNNTILTSTWGKRQTCDLFKYGSSGSNSIPFTATESCPMFKRDGDVSTWGDIRKEGSTTIYLSYRNEANPTGPYATGIWYSTDNTTWTLKKKDFSLCFVELVAGGGGGAGASAAVSKPGAGGGGGGGGYFCAALDLSKTGKVTITVGAGGSEGTSNTGSTGSAGTAGGNSTLKTASGITLTCKGGSGGKCATNGGGSGGQVTNSLGDYFATDPSKGLLDIQVFYGKSGGKPDFGANAGAGGEGFANTDRYYSFGILATDKLVVNAGYHGYGGSMYQPRSGYETHCGGGGAGASALGGGYHSSYSGSHHGYGGGGNGASVAVTDAFWAADDKVGYDTAGCSGGNGAVIIHYTYRGS
jgi:hypothetical protein